MKIKLRINLLIFLIFPNIFIQTIIARPAIHSAQSASLQEQLAAFETAFDGRIGVSAIDTSNNRQIQYRAQEIFPFCSTYKVITVAAILKQSMSDTSLLKQHITYHKEDIVTHSPITKKNLRKGMTISELCAAAITYSDNTAVNLLTKQLGGSLAVTRFAHSIGNNSFRLDRPEPQLNSAIPGDPRDTSTPAEMQHSLHRIALGDVLALPQQQLLQTWLKNNTTGNFKIRASVPKTWAVGDKTGSGDYGTTNDIAIIWPTRCMSPIVMAIYFTHHHKDAHAHDEVIASITKILINEFANTDECLRPTTKKGTA